MLKQKHFVDGRCNLRYENLKIKIAKVKTKSGKTYVKAWLIDTIEKPRFEVDDDTGEQINAETGEIISDIAPFWLNLQEAR